MLDNILVYHWHAWKGFLISHLVADYCQLEARYKDDINDLEKHLTPNIHAILFQVNLSASLHFPARRTRLSQALKDRGICVLNTEIQDITKRHLYQLLNKAGLRSTKADITGPANQPLFVKSNLNCGGVAERRLPQDLHPIFLPHDAKSFACGDNYFTLNRNEIAPEIWLDSNLVIENYICNTESSFYRVYGFGDAIVVVKAHSSALAKKVGEHPRDSNTLLSKHTIITQKTALNEDLQATIRGFILHYRLTYFCLDIVHDHKHHYIIDLNLTPYSGVHEQGDEIIHFLCEGALSEIKQKINTKSAVA